MVSHGYDNPIGFQSDREVKKGLFIIILLSANLLQAHPPWGIVCDDFGNLYFADIMHHGRGSVWKITATGKAELLLTDFHAHNVSLDGQGRLITAHGEEHHTMIRLWPDGRTDTLISSNDHHDFFGGNCTYSPDGEIIFGIEGFLWRIDDEGVREKISEHHLEWNQCILAAADGNFYAPDIGNGRGELWKITRSGTAELLATDLISKFDDQPYDRHDDILLGMAQDEEGQIYICEKAGARIIRINGPGDHKTWYESEEGWFTSGLCFRNNHSYILEFREDGSAGPRVISFDQNGNSQVLWAYTSNWKDSELHEEAIPQATQQNSNTGLWITWLIGGLLAFTLFYTWFRITQRARN